MVAFSPTLSSAGMLRHVAQIPSAASAWGLFFLLLFKGSLEIKKFYVRML